jgi:hypothetical protein
MQYAANSATVSSGSGDNVPYAFNLTWPSLGISIGASTGLHGPDFSLGWASEGPKLLQVNYTFGIPPSGYFFDYDQVPVVDNATSLTDRFMLNGGTFSVAMSGGRFTQRTLSDGWTQLWYWGQSALNITTTGMAPQNTEPSGAVNTAHLLQELGVNYAIVDINRDYGMNERLLAGDFWSGPAVRLYPPVNQSGTVVVFGP